MTTRHQHPSVFYRVADDRVEQLLALGRGLLGDNAKHVAACGRIDAEVSGRGPGSSDTKASP